MQIRKATETDWPRIADIYNQAVDDGACTADTEHISVASRQDWFRSHQSDHHPILVICCDDQIVGWSCLSPFRPGRKALARTVEISYYLDRDHRGRGLGAQLMARTIDEARDLGHRHLFAILLEINAASVALLEKFGFEKWGLMPAVADFGSIVSGLLIYGRRI